MKQAFWRITTLSYHVNEPSTDMNHNMSREDEQRYRTSMTDRMKYAIWCWRCKQIGEHPKLWWTIARLISRSLKSFSLIIFLTPPILHLHLQIVCWCSITFVFTNVSSFPDFSWFIHCWNTDVLFDNGCYFSLTSIYENFWTY